MRIELSPLLVILSAMHLKRTARFGNSWAMKSVAVFFSAAGVALFAFNARAAEPPPGSGKTVALFDGRTLAGWEGDLKLWRVQDGLLTGGSLAETVKQNEFLASTRDYTNFIVRFQIRLMGTNGFINSGFQLRSQRVPNNSEMAGYQADYGEPAWYGCLYDESRRNRVMSASDMKMLRPALNPDPQGWNEYVIRADGPRVTTWINGVLGTDYHEADPDIPDWGKIGIQIHGGGQALVQVRNLTVEELPSTPAEKKFIGAPEPKKTSDNTGNDRAVAQTASKSEPVTAAEERSRFTVAPGFEIELIAQESEGIGKFVAVDWDLHGNLWTMTALEYPVDANENPAFAKELYASKAKDKVVVFDRDPNSPTGYSTQPRVFAAGLAIPLGILPYKNGAYVQHGTEIVFLSDTDGDGHADKREVILSGFGVQDSHLFPHQFTRAPGNWIWMAQGAFNYGKVRTTTGNEQPFDQTRMAKFRADGSDFDITSQGPCNIWGLALTAEGETWIQEANDYGYPAMPFHEYANYPGCSDAQFKSYAPEFPGTAPDFQMGGTGLSGLALSDKTTWPGAYAEVMYVANPITRKIQAIKIHREGPRYRLQKLPDFIQSSDEMFRPVALRLGPDGCLYFVDWYNKIISHNEVPRTHPERDKKRGRIWRVKHKDQTPLAVPDFTKLSDVEILARLGGENTTQSHLAWQAIADRPMPELAPELRRLVGDPSQTAAKRIAALWALEGLHAVNGVTLKPLLGDANRNLRREAIRAHRDNGLPLGPSLVAFAALATDGDPEVRAEIIRTTGTLLSQYLGAGDSRSNSPGALSAIELLVQLALAPLAQPTMNSTQSGKPIKTGEAYEREFERYLVRFELEKHPAAVARFLDSPPAARLPVENRLVATLALEPRTSATRVAQLLPQLGRAPAPEEILRLAQFVDEPGVRESLKATLQSPASRFVILEALLKIRTRLDAGKITPLLVPPVRELLAGEAASVSLGLQLASAFQLAELESELMTLLQHGWAEAAEAGKKGDGTMVLQPPADAILRALRAIHGGDVDLLAGIARSASGDATRNEALAALAASQHERAALLLVGLWPDLDAPQRRTTLDRLTGTKSGAHAVMNALKAGTIAKADLDGPAFEKLQIVLGDSPELRSLLGDMASLFAPCLRLNGADNAWSDADISLDGPFTVETWVKLDPGIDNNDGILGAPGTLDMNFAGEQFRVYVGGELNDVIIAKKKTNPEIWTHIAVTREATGRFRLYLNGELETADSKAAPQKFEHCRIGWTTPGRGTAGWLSEFRIWNRSRTPDEIRRDFDRSYAGEAAPGLVQYFSGTEWGRLQAGARVEKTQDFPALLTATQSQALTEKFASFHSLAEHPGDVSKGRGLFTSLCQVCHSVGGQGGQIGPVLNGAGALGIDALLRNILTPNAAMEPGYRVYRIELKQGEVLDGFRVSEDKNAIVLRRPNSEDARLLRHDVLRSGYTKMSMMPEGLLEALKPGDVSDLFAYLKTLR
jgi:putative membrane-bound dehydrogenase-like protein